MADIWEDLIINRYKISEWYREDNEETREYMRLDVHSQYEEEYQLILEVTKELQKQVLKLKCNHECNHCLYTDSPCIPEDYDKNEMGYCSHYKSIYGEISRLKHENEQLKDKLDKVKRIIQLMLPCMPKENIEGVYEIVEQAEEFLRNEE